MAPIQTTKSVASRVAVLCTTIAYRRLHCTGMNKDILLYLGYFEYILTTSAANSTLMLISTKCIIAVVRQTQRNSAWRTMCLPCMKLSRSWEQDRFCSILSRHLQHSMIKSHIDYPSSTLCDPLYGPYNVLLKTIQSF